MAGGRRQEIGDRWQEAGGRWQEADGRWQAALITAKRQCFLWTLQNLGFNYSY